MESLFSFELFVENIQMEKDTKVSDELALGVRLLDFPTLLVHQPQREGGGQCEGGKRGQCTFNRGKCCFFQMNLDSLHTHLSDSPLYAMVLDVMEEIPKFVGSCLISLAKVMDRIKQDVAEHGVSAPSSYGQRRIVAFCSLAGEKIGSISLSYKLLSLGTGLLPHLSNRRDLQRTKVSRGQDVQENSREENPAGKSLPSDCGNIHSPKPDESDIGRNRQNKGPANAAHSADVCATTKQPKAQIPQTVQEMENYFEEDLTTFCPPHLYYSNSAEEKSKSKGEDYKLLTLDSEVFSFEDSCTEDEMAENKTDGPVSPLMDQRLRHNAKNVRNPETSGMSSNVLGEALRQMPLLNALLVELSQLNGQSPHLLPSVHPNLAWIYRPPSAEPSPQQTAQKNRKTALYFKHLHSPKHCSTPTVRSTSVQRKDRQEEVSIESKSPSKSPGKKLVYGTTKTFNLRLKQISPRKVKHRECMESIRTETQKSKIRGKTNAEKTFKKSSKQRSVLNQDPTLDANIETVIQSFRVDSVLQRTTTLKQKGHDKQHSQRISENLSLPERRDTNFIHIPSVDGGSVTLNRDKNEHHSESDQSESESEKHREEPESSGSSRHSSPKSSFSDSSGKENEADYADDFNSLESSDAYSPDPMSSPEPCRDKALKSPICPDSGSESTQRRAVLPVPIKAPRSPQHALRGTHIIRPRTHASALSISSDNGDRDQAASSQTTHSRQQKAESSRVESSSGAEGLISSNSQISESTKSNSTVRGFSAESVASFEPQEAEELEDELGSLDFRKEYLNISELVANKLPGYTM
ncbi:microtubule-associated protein 10 [Echeneis naucrates]|uniref:microtubule-associated protein 10 n=1 Tax=Echeneis naucrates TaxID=173247 RepID=UPI001113F1A9|nr:microtubule-associated protein 10 [Echeneis naucrates]